MHVDETVLAPLRRRLGAPLRLEIEIEIDPSEVDLVSHSTRKGRYHDVTFFVFHGERLALIRKPHYQPGLWRPPGGGLRPGEEVEQGTRREALEELGVDVTIDRYLVDMAAIFTHGGERIPWRTHVLSATAASDRLEPIDTREISAARWGTLDELDGPIRERLLGTGRPLWGYRVALHDAARAALGGRSAGGS